MWHTTREDNWSNKCTVGVMLKWAFYYLLMSKHQHLHMSLPQELNFFCEKPSSKKVKDAEDLASLLTFKMEIFNLNSLAQGSRANNPYSLLWRRQPQRKWQTLIQFFLQGSWENWNSDIIFVQYRLTGITKEMREHSSHIVEK